MSGEQLNRPTKTAMSNVEKLRLWRVRVWAWGEVYMKDRLFVFSVIDFLSMNASCGLIFGGG